MTVRTRAVLILLALSVACVPFSVAQKGVVEVGIDGELLIYMPDSQNGFDLENVFFVNVPVNSVRVGFFVTDAVSIEPSLSLSFLSSDGDSSTRLGLATGVLYHFTSGDGATPFVGVSGGLSLISFSGGDSESQFSLHGRGGVLLPAGENLAFRLAAGVGRDFESKDVWGGLDVFGQFGLSFFISK